MIFYFKLFIHLLLLLVKIKISVGSGSCRVDDPLSCDRNKNEVCIFRDGVYRCDCPQGISRSTSGRCIIINECTQPRLNDCHENARCIDQIEGYTCECESGYADVSENPKGKPGRICLQKINECADPSRYSIDCSENASCQDTDRSFTCVCNPGFTDISAHYSLLPGRKCVENLNECQTGANDCSSNAVCVDQADGYICKCKEGFVDASMNVTHYPGRECILPKNPYFTYSNDSRRIALQSQHRCDPILQSCPVNQMCSGNAQSTRFCQCPPPSVLGPNGRCMTFNRCKEHHDCDPAAICSNTYDSYKCQCPPGFLDASPDPLRLPGRKCIQLINECGSQTHSCSPFATCIDTLESYLCYCNEGYTDVSSHYGMKPGRRCAQSQHQCENKLANSCDENADCVTLPDGYTCTCASGFIDVSSNAHLPPGRVCTLHTQCPAQPTDLVFLIDGSGSIGSETFHQEILRFVKEFIELFDVSPQKTRVAVMQYSDRIRHEFDLNQYSSAEQLKQAIDQIELLVIDNILYFRYLTGLTRTGAAIEHVIDEVFTERRGARPINAGVQRIIIVITDGRSQDNVSIPVQKALHQRLQIFSVGSEFFSIFLALGSKKRTFHVNGFEDLNARLRSAIQKVTCPATVQPQIKVPPSQSK
ncbi:unnamed protein product [Thelazia callipaeda]|uniref:Transmembrane matrix receptor MUP-4 n=1 Tax=Thelazia callipaeda TaxID=103827 RepID=A0A0N5D784_THECL|nr:unnamed protein product [Thelazia callipaeda]